MTTDPERDPLEEISETAARLIRDALTESRAAVLTAPKLVDGIRNKPVVADGTQEGLKTLSAKLGEAEDMYIKIFSSVTKTYGDDPIAADEAVNQEEEA